MRELRRQFDAGFHERLALDPLAFRDLARKSGAATGNDGHLPRLLVFKGKGLDVAGPYIAKQEWRIGGVQPKPYSAELEALQADNHLRIPALNGDPRDSRISRKA